MKKSKKKVRLNWDGERNHANEQLLHEVFPAEGNRALHNGVPCTVGDDLAFIGQPDRVRITYDNRATTLVKKTELVPYDIVKEYFRYQEQLFKYFGYKQDWKVIPPEDQSGRYWMICGPENENTTSVVYSDEPFTETSIIEGKICSSTIYTQHHLPKWIYRGSEHTMVSVDTHCDGNQLLMIFDNDKECKDQKLMDLYKTLWK